MIPELKCSTCGKPISSLFDHICAPAEPLAELDALRQRVAELEAELKAARKVIALLYKPDIAGEYRFDGECITQHGEVVYDTFVSFKEGIVLTTLHNLFGDMNFDVAEPMLDAILAAID